MIRLTLVVLLCISTIAIGETAEEILDTFEIHPDFKLELVAREPIVRDPVDLRFDHRGRAFVIEFPGYPFSEGANGSVAIIEDTDSDGVYDVRTVFADGFEMADSILPWRDGLLVAAPPDLIYLRDTDDDKRADVRETLLSGFSVGNQQHNYNGLTYGLDNWVYGANGGNQGTPHWPGAPEDEVPLYYDDFRVNLDEKVIERIGRSTGGFGLAVDDFGRIFETHNMVHISHLVFPGRYLENVPTGRSGSLHWDMCDHSEAGTARIFALGEQESRVNHPEQAGYFSGACGVSYYGGGAFPDEFNGNVFVCDVVLNLVHRDVIAPDGASFTASRGREGAEFLASTDRTFRPVNLSTGPDGALYVIDMHREVIEHPEWIPDEIEQNMDLEAGMDEGRIFRIVPRSGLPVYETPNFSKDDPEALLEAIVSTNKWWRDTAQRLIVEWKLSDLAPALEKLAAMGTTAPARVHALWTLHHLDGLDTDTLIAAITDPAAGVRENAIQIAPHYAGKRNVQQAIHDAAKDDDTRVRMYAALAIAETSASIDAVEPVLREDSADSWSRLAVLSVMSQDPANALGRILDDAQWAAAEGMGDIVRSLAEIAARDEPERVVGKILARLSDASAGVQTQLLLGITEGLGLRDGDLSADGLSVGARDGVGAAVDSENADVARAAWRLADTLDMPRTEAQIERIANAIKSAGDSANGLEKRIDAVRIAAYAPFEDREEVLFSLLNPRQPVPIQMEAIGQLGEERSRAVAKRLIDTWDTLGPEVRSRASDILIYQRANHDILLSALEDGRLMMGQLNLRLERRRALLWSNDESIAERAAKLFSDAGVVTRAAAIEAMRPALSMDGVAANGQAVFAERCAKCHQIGGEGGEVGPMLDDIYRKSKEMLLYDILDPNAAVDTEFLSYTIELESDDGLSVGDVITGMIVAQDADTITLRAAEIEDRVIRRGEIASMIGSGLSMMPEELEADLTPQAMADLLAYLQQPR